MSDEPRDRRSFLRRAPKGAARAIGTGYGLGSVLRRSLGAGAAAAREELAAIRGDEGASEREATPPAEGIEPPAPEPPPAAATPPPRPFRPDTEQLAYLARAARVTIAANQDGRGPSVGVGWMHWDGARILSPIGGGGPRAAALRRDSRVGVVVDDGSGRLLLGAGEAELVEGPAAREPTLVVLRRHLGEDAFEAAWLRLVLADPERAVVAIRLEWVAFRQDGP